MSRTGSAKPTPNTPDPGLFTQLEREGALVKRLADLRAGTDIFAGATDEPTRRERVRTAILHHSLETVTFGRSADGKSLNFAQAFKFVYGEELVPTTKRRKSTC